MTKLTAARWISIVGHPFALAVLLGLTPVWIDGQVAGAMRVTGVVIGVAVVPLTLFVRRRRARGEWETVDASRPTDRPALFRATFAAVAMLGLYFGLVEQSTELVRGAVAVGLLIAVAAMLNRWVKLSLHMAFATFTAIVLVPYGVPHWAPVAGFLPLLGWSRLALGRHSPAELVVGLCLGGAIGTAVVYA